MHQIHAICECGMDAFSQTCLIIEREIAVGFRVLLVALGAMVVLNGCGSLNPSDYSASKSSKDFGVAIIGVPSGPVELSVYDLHKSPMVEVVKIKKDGDYAKPTDVLSSGDFGRIEGGYAYVSLPPTKEGERYVVLNYLTNGLLGTRVSFMCYRQPAPAFEVKAGEVIYVGDYSILNVSGNKFAFSWSMGFERDVSKAMKAIGEKHPDLISKVREADLVYWRANAGARCEEK